MAPLEDQRREHRQHENRLVTIAALWAALVLCAVFIPTAFISGLTGQFYKQFAITIAISTVISAFNSLTLSPALCAVLLRSHHAPKDLPTRVIDPLLGWFFRPFNRFFAWASERYAAMRIMMVTTESEIENVQQALAAGADEYVMKPFTRDIIVEKLGLLGIVRG